MIENHLEIETHKKKARIHGNEQVGIYKIRLKPNANCGKSFGYRIILLVSTINNKAYVLHIYNKTNKYKSKWHKSALSKQETKNLKKILQKFEEWS